MVYLCLLVIVGVLVYSYVIKPQKDDKDRYGQSRKTADAQSRKTADAQSIETADAQSRKTADAQSRKTADAQSRKTSDAQSRKTSDAQSSETADAQSRKTADGQSSETADAQSNETAGAEAFPYPAKTPSGCRFPGEPEISNFQDYGEEPVEMQKDDFNEWWFFSEDSDKPCWSYVGTDKQNHCILQRRYRYGTPDQYTFETRHFVIKRNIMASAFALALIQDKMERRNYFEVMERLDKQFPPTENPEIDGPEILLPPQELLDNPSKEEIEEAAIKKEREELPCKVVYQDNKRKLYFAEYGHTPMFDYGGKTYSLSCHPYEPMLIIKQNGTDVVYVHNAFYPDDEYKGLLKGQLVHTITGMYHNAERFARILSTAVDTCCDRIQDVEIMMLEDLVLEKGKDAIEYATHDFRCDRVLYEGVALLLGHFDIYTGIRRKADGEKVYALAFGYPHNGTDMYEYYLITREEYREYMEWEKRQDWQSHEAAYEWHEAHLAGRQVLCNEFSHMKKSYKPFFHFSELPK